MTYLEHEFPKEDWVVAHKGDVVVLKPRGDEVEIRRLTELLEFTAKETGITFVLLPKGWEFNTLPESEMNQAGWYRKE